MGKLSEKSRKLLKMVYRGLGVTTASLVLQGCGSVLPGNVMVMYGPPPDWINDVAIQGVVLDGKTSTPIPGIKVAVTDSDSHVFTDNGGYFIIYVPKQDAYTIEFLDVDGFENGGLFRQHTMNVTLAETEEQLNIGLDEDDTE